MKNAITFVFIMENEITNAYLKELSNDLKSKYTHWVSLVAEQISKQKDWQKYSNMPCTEQNARHISTGVIKNQFHRRLFVKAAAIIVTQYNKEVSEMQELLAQTK